MHVAASFLQQAPSYILIYGSAMGWQALLRRDKKRALREAQAQAWPTVEGRAMCRVLPHGLAGFRLTVRGVATDGAGRADWARVFPLKEEADYYARALAGRTVAVHVNPEDAKERILCWEEMRRMALPFVSETEGRLTPGGFRGAKAFCAAGVAGFGLALADVAAFATPWGRNFAWHGWCLCEFSLALLGLGMGMLIPAKLLRARMRAVPGGEGGSLDGFWRSGTIGLSAAAAATFLVLAAYAALGTGFGDSTPDAVVFAMIVAPIFPLMWWAMAVGVAAVRQLRPVFRVGATGVAEEPRGAELRGFAPQVRGGEVLAERVEA